ncbi:MAG: transcription termination/antitermination protein NusA [Clostridia bacterium]|nr:transcription termination/antitermination protein NusA [Clostridia bacterium]
MAAKVNELQEALTILEKDKGIRKEYILDALETALMHSYRKNYKDDSENVEIKINDLNGDVRVISKKTVVDGFDPDLQEGVQIALEDAQKIKSAAQIGDEIEVELAPKNFGRIAAQTAKQIILQKLREAEREQILAEFQIKANDVIPAVVQRFERVEFRNPERQPQSGDKPKFNVILDIGKAEAVMPPREQVQHESYKPHDRIAVYVVDVKSTPRGPYILVSRSQPDLVKRLFEREVPEIKDGVVEIKSIAREAGVRSKIAVWSNDENVDPVGSCVGNRGIRVNAVVDSLGEKVDIIKYSENPLEFITAAISPATVLSARIDEGALAKDEKKAQIIVEESQLSLAIGKEGLNARLAARLTGWKIDIKSSKDVPLNQDLQAEEPMPEAEDIAYETEAGDDDAS